MPALTPSPLFRAFPYVSCFLSNLFRLLRWILYPFTRFPLRRGWVLPLHTVAVVSFPSFVFGFLLLSEFKFFGNRLQHTRSRPFDPQVFFWFLNFLRIFPPGKRWFARARSADPGSLPFFPSPGLSRWLFSFLHPRSPSLGKVFFELISQSLPPSG